MTLGPGMVLGPSDTHWVCFKGITGGPTGSFQESEATNMDCKQ